MTATLYRFFDADGALLYVGISEHPLVRLDMHTHTQPWWSLVTSATFEQHQTREDARAAELAAIRSEHPAFNVADNGDPRLSDRLQAWESRNERRLQARARSAAGHPDYSVPPFDVACRSCLAPEFEPCRTPSGRSKEEAHGCRPQDSRQARRCTSCGQLPPPAGDKPGPPRGASLGDRL